MLTAANAVLSMGATEVIGQDTHGTSLNPAITPLTDGTGPNKAQKAGQVTVTLSGSVNTPTDIDMTAFAGGLGGVNINFSKVKELFILNNDPVNTITYSGTQSNGWTNFCAGANPLGPGAPLALAPHLTGIVVDGAHKLLRLFATAAASVTIQAIGEGT